MKTPVLTDVKSNSLIGLFKVFVLCALIIAVFLPVSAFATSVVAEGYDGEVLESGSLVSFKRASGDEVELATSSNIDRVVGVVATEGDPAIELAKTSQSNLVVRSGKITAFVTNINGEVSKGDLLTISPISGVLTRAIQDTDPIIAVAAESFKDSAASKTVTLSDGSIAAKIYGLKVDLYERPSSGSKELSPLRRFVYEITGEEVSMLRTAVSALVFLTAVTYGSVLLFSSVKNGLTAVGRNPLASGVIVPSLLKTSGLAMLITLIGAAVAYAVVKV